MNNKYHLSLFAYALILAYPALGASQFTPFPPTPLNLQPKPADMVPPNTLFFIDNSYDSCKGSQTNWLCDAVTGEAMAGRNEESKLTVLKKVVTELVSLPKYKSYRFGAAGYQQGKIEDLSLPFFEGQQCGIQSWPRINQGSSFNSVYDNSLYANRGVNGYFNWRVTPCYGEKYDTLKHDYSEVRSAHNTLKGNETGAIIYVPITSNKDKFKAGLKDLPKYKDLNGGYSPVSSAYLELTRYYRGLTSATGKNGGEKYTSPIEYRCQQNNIVFVSSAEDIRLYDPRLEVASFYEAFHNDPLYKHDHAQYSVELGGRKIKAIGDDRSLGQPNSAQYNKYFKGKPLESEYEINEITNPSTNKSIRYNPFFDHITGNVIDFIQYHEKRSLEGFVHLAQVGDILEGTAKDGKGKEVNGKDVDKEGMKWDGTSPGDSVHNTKQNIRTFTVNYQLKPSDFPKLKIKAHGITDADSWNRRYIRFDKKPNQVIDDGDCVYYENKPLKDEDGKFIRTGILSPVFLPNIGPYIHLSAEPPAEIKPGGSIQIISKAQVKNNSCEIKEISDTDSSILLSKAGGKSGGFYSVSSSTLKDTLEHILDQIAASVISLPVGSALGSNDAKISTAITPTLSTDRWLSQLRFYNLQPDGIFKEDDFKLPDYTKSSTTLISTPKGVRELSEDDTQNKVTLNNEAFNIGNPDNLPTGSKVDHNGKHGLLVANSSRTEEWQSLVKWLLQSTDNDRDNAFKSNIFGVDKLVYRDRAPNNKGSRGHLLGDILDSNIVTFGGEESPVTGKSGKETYKTGNNHPYLAVGANDGMLHIFESNEKDAQTEHPYFHKFAYIPGTAKRTGENDTIMRNLVYTAEQNYGTQSNPHQYFVNGEIFYRKTDSGLVGQSDQGQMMLVGSLGQGGRAAYSLNIGGERYGSKTAVKVGLEATTGNVVDNVPLWDTSTDQFGKAKAGVDENMGYPIGSPQVGRVSLKDITDKSQFGDDANVRYATFLNSGVDSGKNPTLFVLDQLGVNAAPKAYDKVIQEQKNAGELIKAIEAGDKVGGLAAPLFVDYNRDGISDFVYAGDSNGNMWRFELRGGTANWKAIQIYQGSPTQPITTAPDIYYDGKGSKIYVFFGTGSVLYQKDFKDKNKQAMFGIVDDFSCPSNCAVSKDQLTKRELKEQTLEAKQGKLVVGSQEVSNTYREVTVLPEGSKLSGKGWYTPLSVDPNANNGSERVVVRPFVIADQYHNSGTVFFTTRTFQDIHATVGDVSCTPPPVKVKSWVMGLDVHTGGNPKKVRLGNLVNSKASIAGYLVDGQASAFLRTDSGAEINQHGAGTQGIATPLLNPNQSVVKVVRACKVDGTANTAISIQNPDGSSTVTRFELDCGKLLSRRLSWREIF